jgi:hypothetical protein
MTTPIRLRVTTVSGSRYAFWGNPDTGTWWIRPRSIPSRTALPLPDRWARVDRPTPWPPDLNAPLELVFPSSTPRQLVELGGAVLAFHVARRLTAAVVEIEPWSPFDEWPGDPTMTAKRTEERS